ncbi:MAG: CehA/McbA family metallohydrolase [Verrucomicrobia bacterium]|nr:CehA/McbA family metallohydrolase [Verrucomicrobiota bacterium]
MKTIGGGTLLLAVLLGAAMPSRLDSSEAPTNATRAAVLRGTVLDAVTGRPTACTVAIIDATGHTVSESEGYRGGFRCEGRFSKNLPPGRTRLRVTRGFETRAVERVLELKEGQDVSVELRLERVVDLRRRGWFAGDSHAHMIHGERTLPVNFDDVALAARAEDLQYFSLAHAWSLTDPTPERLAAELTSRSTPECLLTWNLEAPKNYYRGDAGRCLGHCWTLGMRGRTPEGRDVIPLLQQASAHDYESDKPSFANFESHHLIRAQGGAAFYSHPARWWTGPWGGQGGYPKQDKMRVSNLAVELPLDTLLGPTFDGIDVLTGAGEFQANAMAFELWCLLLNHGYRVAATASSDSCFDRPGGATPGAVRTYTFLDEPFSLPAATRATARGRTFATSGPLLLATLDHEPPGSSFAADGRERQLAIEAWASGAETKGLTRLEVLKNGKPFWTNVCSPACLQFSTNLVLRETADSWFCVRVFGADPQRQRAVSGAFFFDAQPHQPPTPVPARVQANLVDATTGQGISGTVTEVTFHATLPRDGRKHDLGNQGGVLIVPGTVRLRAEAPGYQPVTLSPVLDHPELVEAVTRLEAADLLRWETFERMRRLLGQVRLTFRLEKVK